MLLFTAEVKRVSVTEPPVSVMGLEDGVSSSYINKNDTIVIVFGISNSLLLKVDLQLATK